MLNFYIGESGHGKSYAMAEEISRLAESGEKILVIVPDQYSFEFDKKLYNAIGPQKYNSITVLSFQRLAEDIMIKYGGKSGEYINETAKTAFAYLAVENSRKKESLCFFEKQLSSPAFACNMLQTIKELKTSDISAEMLASKIALLPSNLREKASDISIIFSEYSRLLEENGFKDSLDDISYAAEIANLNGYFENLNVFVDEFNSFSGSEFQMLDAIISKAKNVCFSIVSEGIPDGKKLLFATTSDTYFRLIRIAEKYNADVKNHTFEKAFRFSSKDIEHLSKNILRPAIKTKESCSDVKIVEASDVYAEIDFICAEIKRLIKTYGWNYSQIAVIGRNLEDYSSIIESAFEKYEIPLFLDIKKSVASRPLMLFAVSALKLASMQNPSTEVILQYLKTGLAGIPFEEISRLENYCYKWNIDGKTWFEDFLEEDDEQNKCPINEIRKKILSPILKFKGNVKNCTGGEICSAFFNFLEEINIKANASFFIGSEKIGNESERLVYIREFKQIWEIMLDILESIHCAFEDVKISLSEFKDLFSAMVSQASFSAPPQTLDCATASNAERARLSSPKAVFVIGANEGIFPLAPKSSGILSEREKAAFKEIGLEISIDAKQMTNAERLVVYSALSSPSEKLYISYPLSDFAGKSVFPSHITEQISKMFGCGITIKTSQLGIAYFCASKKSAYYTYVQNFKKNDEESESLKAFLQEIPEYSGRISMLQNINENAGFKISNKETAEKLWGKKIRVSASRFEDFQKCPFVFFCKKGLNLYPIQKVEINEMEQGNAIHQCLAEILKSFFSGVSDDEILKSRKNEFINFKEKDFREKIEKILNARYEQVLGGNFSKNQRFIKNYYAVEDIVIEILLHMQKEIAQSDFIPSDFEIKIFEDGDAVPFTVELENGKKEISFCGIADRVDILSNDKKGTYIRVIDYKSGEKKFNLSDLIYGLNMQMLIYLFALNEQKSGKYEGSKPAGVLYMPSKELEPGLGRNADDSEKEDLKLKQFKMNGLLIENEEIIKAMEKGEIIQGKFIPVKQTSGGFHKNSSIIPENGFKSLKNYAEKLLAKMAEKLYNGEIDALPLGKGTNLPCDYCDYWSVCGNENKKSRPYVQYSKEQIENIINEIVGGQENG
jgi:ATP-dependent helicase/nuclease subunit B